MGEVACGKDQHFTNTATYNTLVTEIYDSVTRPEGFDPFLAKLCEYTNSSSANMTTFKADAGSFMGGWQHGFKPEDITFYLENGMVQDDPIMQAVLNSVPGKFITFREAMVWEEFQKSDTYKNWAEPLGLIDSSGSLICSEGSVVTTLFIQRVNEQGQFSLSNIELFNSLIPHLQRAIALYLRLLESNSGNLPLTAALNTFKVPTIIFDPRGVVIFANDKASEFIEKRRWIAIEEGAITSHNSMLRTKLSTALVRNITYAFSDINEEPSIIHIDIDGESVAFCMQPLNASAETGQHGGALLFIHRQHRTIDESKIRMIEELFHLTPAEAQVALLLSQGMTIKLIAEFTKRKENTTRVQLKSAFAKTGVNSQSQLVSLILTSPVFLT